MQDKKKNTNRKQLYYSNEQQLSLSQKFNESSVN